MPSIETATGAIDSLQLGTTLVHEHLIVRDEAVAAQWPDSPTFGGIPARPLAAEAAFQAAVECAQAAVGLGIDSICDPTAMFLGRDVRFARRVSEKTGLQVVPCTGIYTFGHLPDFFANRSADEIAAFFVADIERGIQGTDIKAAFIKCAADEPGVTESVEKIHRAAARASVRTGAAIMAHSCPARRTGLRQVEIFEEEGVDPARVHIAHTGDTADLRYIEQLLAGGVFIGMDRFGQELYLPFDHRCRVVATLVERGHASRMLLSADSCATLDWFPVAAAEEMISSGKVRDADIRIVPTKVVPELRARGVSDHEIETMLVANPVKWLAA